LLSLNDSENLKLLLKNGADFDVKDNKGRNFWEYSIRDIKSYDCLTAIEKFLEEKNPDKRSEMIQSNKKNEWFLVPILKKMYTNEKIANYKDAQKILSFLSNKKIKQIVKQLKLTEQQIKHAKKIGLPVNTSETLFNESCIERKNFSDLIFEL